MSVILITLFGAAFASPLSWFESEIGEKRGMVECPGWASDADACATGASMMGNTLFVAINTPPTGYNWGDPWDQWAQFPDSCYRGSTQAWNPGCRVALDLVGPTDAVIALQDGLILFYADNPALHAQIANYRSDLQQQRDAIVQGNRNDLAARRAAKASGKGTETKIHTFSQELFKSMNIGRIDCPASQAAFRIATCGQTHGDAEMFRIITDLFLQTTDWFDGEIVTEWLGLDPIPHIGLRIDDTLVTITFEGNLGPFENFGRVYINAN